MLKFPHNISKFLAIGAVLLLISIKAEKKILQSGAYNSWQKPRNLPTRKKLNCFVITKGM